MLKDKDRIFQNLYNDLGYDLSSSKKRGDWVNTKSLIFIGIPLMMIFIIYSIIFKYTIFKSHA